MTDILMKNLGRILHAKHKNNMWKEKGDKYVIYIDIEFEVIFLPGERMIYWWVMLSN